MSSTVPMVSAFVGLLFKAIKSIQLYRHANSQFASFLEPAYAALESLLQDREELRFLLGPTTLEHENQIVHTDESKQSLIYKLYRDGVRIVSFRSSIELAELLVFTLLLVEAEQRDGASADDMVVRLWKAELRNIEFIAVESFTTDSAEGGELELERMVAYLQRQLAAREEDAARIARFSIEDVDVDRDRVDLETVQSAKEVDPTSPLTALLVQEEDLLLPKMALVLFNVLELNGRTGDFTGLAEALTVVLDGMLLSGDMSAAVGLFRRLDELARTLSDQEKQQLAARMVDSLRALMVQRQRLDTLLVYLNQSNEIDVEGTRDYLRFCTAEQLDILLEHLSRMERSDRRELLLEALVELGRSNVDVFVAQLQDKSVNRVRDTLSILQRIDAPVKAKIVATYLAHESLSVRLEALKILAKSDEPEAVAPVEEAASDDNLRVRLTAYRALAAKNPKRAFEVLSARMMSREYHTMDQQERIVIATVLGETEQPEALELLRGLFQERRRLFGRGRQKELRSMAIVGLEAMGTVRAFRALADELRNAENTREIQEACRAAALRLKKKLTGRSAA